MFTWITNIPHNKYKKMSLFKRVNERKILHTPIEPSSTSWLWLKTKDGVSTLYDYVNGKWTVVGGSGDSVPVDYTRYDNIIREFKESVNTKLDEFSKKTVDLTDYYNKTEVDKLISDISVDVHDGITPHIDHVTKHWFLDTEDTGVNAESVGIKDMSYVASQASGGTNKLTITTTDNVSRTFNIMNGKDGQGSQGGGTSPEVITVEVLSVSGGTFQEALSKASQNQSVMFQWILQDVDKKGNSFKKVIWHIGGSVFIDANGTEIAL